MRFRVRWKLSSLRKPRGKAFLLRLYWNGSKASVRPTALPSASTPRSCQFGISEGQALCTARTSTTMPVESGLVDANVLVYAIDADAPQRGALRALLDAARASSTTLFVTPQVLCEFYSIVTNSRRVPRPRSPEDAMRAISILLVFLHVLPTPARVVEAWLDLLRRRPVLGGHVFDLQIAATMQVNGVQRIYTFNASDFEVFPELAVVTSQCSVQQIAG